MRVLNTYQNNSTQTDLIKLRGCYQLSAVGLEEVEVLAGLGLTERQARVYLALIKAGDARARAISRLALINRQDVYLLLESLQRLGLVQQNVTVPNTYSATPIAEGIRLLLEQKTSELSLISQKAKRLSKKLNQPIYLAQMAAASKPCFGVVSEADRGKKYLKAIQGTQHTIQAVTSWTRFKRICFLFESQLKDALKKGITIHIVTEKPSNHQLPKWVSAALSKYSNFELKTQLNPPVTAVTIFDSTQSAIAFNPHIRFTKGTDLWTTNLSLTALCQAYFNANWTQTITKN